MLRELGGILLGVALVLSLPGVAEAKKPKPPPSSVTGHDESSSPNASVNGKDINVDVRNKSTSYVGDHGATGERRVRIPTDYELFAMYCTEATSLAHEVCHHGTNWVTFGKGGGQTVDVPAVARSAVAKLTLPGSVPKVGPPPSINEWKMAAVGYPLWLWTNDATRLSTRVESQGITITITAKRTSTTFAMGDGGSLTCESMTPWSRAVTPGLHSPDCGYTYVKASLPRGNYTITATTTWSVHWTAEGYSGDIPVTISGTSELPVGELQSLVTKRR